MNLKQTISFRVWKLLVAVAGGFLSFLLSKAFWDFCGLGVPCPQPKSIMLTILMWIFIIYGAALVIDLLRKKIKK